MLKQLDSTTERARKGRTEGFERLKLELTVHEAIEEELFYPTLKRYAEADADRPTVAVGAGDEEGER